MDISKEADKFISDVAPNAGPAQISDMKSSFMSGAFLLFEYMTKALVEMDEDEAAGALYEVSESIVDYMNSVPGTGVTMIATEQGIQVVPDGKEN